MYTTTIFTLIELVLSAFVCLVFFASYVKTRKPATLSLFFLFFSIALASLSFSLPALIDKNDFRALSYGYIIGTGFLYVAIFAGVKVLLFLSKSVAVKTIIVSTSLVILPIAFINIGIMVYDFKLPLILPSNMINWNVNPIASWLFGISILSYGILWWYTFNRSALLVSEVYARRKLTLIGLTGLLLGLSALIIRTSTTPTQSFIGHLVFVAAVAVACSIYFISKKHPESR